MKITEIRVKLMTGADERGEKLKAFCSVTFDNEIVVRDVKLIEGPKGLFVAMPSRKITDHCRKSLAAYKVPRLVRFAAEEELPLTTTGKVQKNRLAATFFTTRG